MNKRFLFFLVLFGLSISLPTSLTSSNTKRSLSNEDAFVSFLVDPLINEQETGSVSIVSIVTREEPTRKNKAVWGVSIGLGSNGFSSLTYRGTVPFSMEIKIHHKDVDLGIFDYFLGRGIDETSLIYEATSGESIFSMPAAWTNRFVSSIISRAAYSGIGIKHRIYFFNRFSEDGFSLGLSTHLFNLKQTTDGANYSGYDCGVELGGHFNVGDRFMWDNYVVPQYSHIETATIGGMTGKLPRVYDDFKINFLSQVTLYFF